MKCEDCANLDKDKHPKHALIGFGLCKANKLPGQLVSIVIERNCEWYKPKGEEV